MRWYSVIAVLLLGLLASCGGNGKDFDATGAFEATEILVSAQATGEIVELSLQEGRPIEAGVPVGVIDTTQLYLQKLALLSSNKGLRVQRSDVGKQLSVIEEQLETLRSERKRVEQLLAANVATQKQLDDIDNQMRVLESQLAATSSSLQKSSASISAQSSAVEIQVAQVEEQIRKSVITSPISGVVLRQYAHKGELATAGTPLFRVANLDELDFRAYITNDQLSQVKLSDIVQVCVDDGVGGMRCYEGEVQWIASEAEFTPKGIQTKKERSNLVYAMKVRVPNVDGLLKIGMYGELHF